MTAARRSGATSAPRPEYPFPSVTSGHMNGVPGTTLPPMHAMGVIVPNLNGITSQPHHSGPSMPTALTQSMMPNGHHAAHPHLNPVQQQQQQHGEGGHYYQDEQPVHSYIGHHPQTSSAGWDPWTQPRYYG